MNLPAGSELWMIGLGAFLVCLVVLNATARRGDSSSYDELERAGSHNGSLAFQKACRLGDRRSCFHDQPIKMDRD